MSVPIRQMAWFSDVCLLGALWFNSSLQNTRFLLGDLLRAPSRLLFSHQFGNLSDARFGSQYGIVPHRQQHRRDALLPQVLAPLAFDGNNAIAGGFFLRTIAGELADDADEFHRRRDLPVGAVA